jgi:sugar phosphate isomerase/epimerase
MPHTQLTILNSMAGAEFESALRQHVQWGLHWLDLKDGIFGKGILDLTDAEALRAREAIAAHGLEVWCLSTVLFDDDIEQGQAAFTARIGNGPARAARLAELLKSRKVRLLAARTSARPGVADSMAYLDAKHPWLIPLYARAAEAIAASGSEVTIENEAHACIFASPGEVLGFFRRLKAATSADVSFTWDVQNFWQMGQFPTIELYQALRPLIRYYHVKGGICDQPRGKLVYRSSLEDASWPVEPITRQVIRDGISPVICLNPPHGAPKPGYDYADLTRRDLDFLRRRLEEVQ